MKIEPYDITFLFYEEWIIGEFEFPLSVRLHPEGVPHALYG